jgi:hypothetical protein
LVRDIPPASRYTEAVAKLITITTDEDKNISILGPDSLTYDLKESTITGAVYSIDHTSGDVVINEEMLDALVNKNQINLDNGLGIYIISINDESVGVPFTDDDIDFKLPFGFETVTIIHKDGNTIIIIQKDVIVLEGEDELNGENK